MIKTKLPKILAIVGPTSVGKTAFALQLAKKFGGELLSADSRQVYRGLDIGTGKDLPQNPQVDSYALSLKGQDKLHPYLIQGVRLWLCDLVDFRSLISVSLFSKIAKPVLADVTRRGKLPILVGGTGLYVKLLTDGIATIGIPPDVRWRRKSRDLSSHALFSQLKKLDQSMAMSLNLSDRNNQRRLIRKIEIARYHAKSQVKFSSTPSSGEVEMLQIGLTAPNEFLYRQIDARVDLRLRQGLLQEINTLLEKGANWQMQSMTSLGYRQWQKWFTRIGNQTEETKNAIISKWKFAEHAYARRQLTWFRKDKRIHWFDITASGWSTEVVCKITAWYNDGRYADKN
jgi:tRNA dimethylallyltransferase